MNRVFALCVWGFVTGGAFTAVRAETVESFPLAELAESGYEGPLFELLSPENTNLSAVNVYDHPEAWGKYWMQYYNGSIGAGVAIGDVNGDGLADLFFVSKDTEDALYINKGDFVFEDVTAEAGVAGKQGFGSGASFVDIDNDGDLDLYVGYVGSANELFINDGSGRFVESAEAWGLAINTGTNAPSFADMDRDGDLDLYLQCNFLAAENNPVGMPDLLFENKGDHFVEITEKAGIEGRGQGHAAIWWDYDEDGWPDIYVANDFEPTDKLYRNNGDNTFTDVIKEALVSSPYFGMGADLGDINNDGHVDFIVADMAAYSHEKHHVSTGTQGNFLLSISKSKISQFMYNMLSLKIGPNQFAEVAQLTGLEATGWTWAARLVDMDNDGWLDAYFATGMVREFHNSDVASKMGRFRSVKHRIRSYQNSPMLVEENLAYRNDGDFSFEEMGDAWGLNTEGVSFAAGYADFDRDGDLDLVVNNLNAPPTIYRNRSENGQRVTIRLEGVSSNRFGFGARVTAEADGMTQTREHSVTRGYMSQDEPHLHFAFPKADRIEELRIEWPSGKVQVLRDLATGRHYRIREADTGESDDESLAKSALFSLSAFEVPDDTESEEEYFDPFITQPLLPFDESSMGPRIALGDLDGDGWVDMVLGGATGQETRVFKNEGGNGFDMIESDDFYDDYDREDSDFGLFDFDGDSDLDLLVLGGSTELDSGDEYYTDRLYENTGELEFARLEGAALPAEALSSSACSILDVNGDGLEDIVIGGGGVKDQYPYSQDNQVWIRKGDGYLLDEGSSFAKAFANSGRVLDLLAVDMDGDGDLDLAQANEWGSPLLWINEAGSWSQARAIFSQDRFKGLWRSLAAGDFDGDGRMDLFVGNVGISSRYHPEVGEPSVLLTRVRGGRADHFEAKSVEGAIVPSEVRNIASKLFEAEITAATRSFAEYAMMPVEQLFPNLETEFRRDEIFEERSFVFLQTAPGVFEPKEMPRIAQAGMARDALASDLNGDGFEDLVILHEPLPPVSWTGRRLQGHLSVLLGGEGGDFEVMLPWQSGLSTGPFPSRLAMGDLNNDGLDELLVSQRDGLVLVFERN